jgi:exosortase J
VLLLVISPSWTTLLPPASLPLLLYGTGAVLLLGGTRLLRGCTFPVALLWLANPVPHAFSVAVDLPLQALSAQVARSFAMHLGQPLTPDHLRLMFTPEFGMFIAPGCNGIRGSISMGLIALVAGYVYRFRWMAHAAIIALAVLLGYLFNLLRLCALVLYYIVALHLPWLKDKAEGADYVIGAILFLCASLLLFSSIDRLRGSRQRWVEAVPADETVVRSPLPPAAALAAIGLVCTMAFVPVMRAGQTLVRPATQRFAQTIGEYQLVRTWEEPLSPGTIAYQWAEYAKPNGSPVAIGISPSMSWHDPVMCHMARGESPLWQGPVQMSTAEGKVNFNATMYADGITQTFEVSTQCVGGTCNEFATQRTHFGLVYSALDRSSLLNRLQRSLPLLVRADTPAGPVVPSVARTQLSASVESFLASVSLADLTRP